MQSLLLLVVVILVIGWLIGFFAYGMSGLIHTLLAIASVAVLIYFINGSRRV